MWIGSPNSSSSSRAFIEAFCMIRFDIPMYSLVSKFLSFCIFINSLIVFESPDKNSAPSTVTDPNSL